jgi:hypothetical protein
VSLEPVKDLLKIRQGATVDQSWQFFEPVPEGAISDPTDPDFAGVPTDFTGCTAKATLRKDRAVGSPEIKSITDGTVGDPPAADAIELGPDGLVRIYLRDESTQTGTMDRTAFTDLGGGKYGGVMDVEIEHVNGERHRYLELKVAFYPEIVT